MLAAIGKRFLRPLKKTNDLLNLFTNFPECIKVMSRYVDDKGRKDLELYGKFL